MLVLFRDTPEALFLEYIDLSHDCYSYSYHGHLRAAFQHFVITQRRDNRIVEAVAIESGKDVRALVDQEEWRRKKFQPERMSSLNASIISLP
jgi:hypothetical protein